MRKPIAPACCLIVAMLLLPSPRPVRGQEPAEPAGESRWELPTPGDCSQARTATAADATAAGLPFQSGESVASDRFAELEPYLPPEVWAARERLLPKGTRLEIGACFRSYAPPAYFREATLRHAGQARLLARGGLEGAPAGLPFDPERLAADDSQAGQKWAWNAARRHRGAGRFGEIRVSYAAAGGTTTNLVGDHFVAQLLGRADLARSQYRLPWAKKERWVAGGLSRDPSSGRRCAFRHNRGAAAERGGERDDVFLWSSGTRKQERVGWDPEFPLLACAYERGWYLPRGGRVERYRWRVVAVRDLLAPINARTPAYPSDANRDFGSSGASLANDRWDLRRALVVEAPGGPGQYVRRYLDLETLFPLYHVDAFGAAPVILQYAGRWSEDRGDYPPGDAAPRVIDPVVEVMLLPTEVVRFEAWETVSMPPKGKSLRRLVSTASLSKGR